LFKVLVTDLGNYQSKEQEKTPFRGILEYKHPNGITYFIKSNVTSKIYEVYDDQFYKVKQFTNE